MNTAALKMRGAYIGNVPHGTLGRKAHQMVLDDKRDPVLLQASSHPYAPCPVTPVVAAQNNVLWESISQPTQLGDRS